MHVFWPTDGIRLQDGQGVAVGCRVRSNGNGQGGATKTASATATGKDEVPNRSDIQEESSYQDAIVVVAIVPSWDGAAYIESDPLSILGRVHDVSARPGSTHSRSEPSPTDALNLGRSNTSTLPSLEIYISNSRPVRYVRHAHKGQDVQDDQDGQDSQDLVVETIYYTPPNTRKLCYMTLGEGRDMAQRESLSESTAQSPAESSQSPAQLAPPLAQSEGLSADAIIAQNLTSYGPNWNAPAPGKGVDLEGAIRVINRVQDARRSMSATGAKFRPEDLGYTPLSRPFLVAWGVCVLVVHDHYGAILDRVSRVVQAVREVCANFSLDSASWSAWTAWTACAGELEMFEVVPACLALGVLSVSICTLARYASRVVLGRRSPGRRGSNASRVARFVSCTVGSRVPFFGSTLADMSAFFKQVKCRADTSMFISDIRDTSDIYAGNTLAPEMFGLVQRRDESAVSVSVDIILGIALSYFLWARPTPRVPPLADVLSTPIISALHWLNNWPVGLKLNTPLSATYTRVFSLFLAQWRHHADPTFKALCRPLSLALRISSLGGASFPLALLSDLFAASTAHLTLCAALTSTTARWQLMVLKRLWDLFRGQRWNALRKRADSHAYDLDTLFLGTLLFTLSAFLAPTVVVYAALFALVRVGITVGRGMMGAGVRGINGAKVYSLYCRDRWPGRVPDGVVFVVDKRGALAVRSTPTGYGAILGEWAGKVWGLSGAVGC